MKKLNRPWIALVILALAGLIAGCTTTRTSESAGQYIDDAAITAKVKAALLNAEDVPATQISVETTNGVVRLNGFVDSRHAERRAVAVTRTVDGVKDVQDRITVRGTPSRG